MQTTEQDCLLACVSMVLSSAGIDLLPHELYEGDALPPDGLTARYLRQIDAKIGTRTRAYRDPSGGKPHEIFASFGRPAIAHWNANHFVVVTSITRQHARIIDPALGKMRLTLDDFSRQFSGVWIVVEEGDRTAVRTRTRPPSALRSFVSKHLGLLLLGLAVAQGASIAIAAGVREVLSTSHIWAVTGGLIALLLVLYVASALALTAAQRGLTDRFEQHYSESLFRSLLRRPYLYFKSQTTGALIEIIGLRGSIRDVILSSAVPSAVSFLTVIVLVMYLGWISPPLTIVACALALIFTILAAFAVQKEREASQNYVQRQVAFTSAIQHDVHSIDEAKVTRTEDLVAERWASENSRLADAFKATLSAQNLSMVVQRIYYGVSLVVVAAVGIYLYQVDAVSMPDIVLFQAGVGMLTSATSDLQTFFVAGAKAAVFEQRQAPIREVRVAPSEDVIADDQGIFMTARNVSFSYPGGDRVFDPVSFTIRQGERIALVGESGSGKSTLLHVLMGLLAHQGVVEHGHDRVRQELGVVLPGMSLHVGTVRGNLTGSDDDFPDSKIWAALDAVGLAEIVYSLPRGLDSAVLESGRNFSSGQAQRLLVAKSLIRGRSGVFWDEALSGLDPHTRVRTYERVILSDDWRQTSMIIVSHQMDILAHVDRVIYLDGEGGAPTIGTAHELEQSNPRYRAFVAETHALRP